MPKRLAPPIAVVVGSFALAACGNGSSSAAPSASAQGPSATVAKSSAPAPSASEAVAIAKPGADFKPHKLPKRDPSEEHAAMAEFGPGMVSKPVLGTFEGEYISTYGGLATATQVGSTVTIKYNKGEVNCTAGGDVLDCGWTQPDKSGRAVFIKTATGLLDGTYGLDASNADQGAWAFIPTSSPEQKPADANFVGHYVSSFGGDATIEGEGRALRLKYKNGESDCVAAGDVLNCAWKGVSKSGRAIFLRNENGSLFGSWGRDASYSNGGPWSFTFVEPPPPPAPPAPPPPAPPPPAPPPSDGYASDGLPIDIPATGSKPPSVSEWASVTREVTVWGSSALSCETKMLREWLRVSCRATAGSTPVDVQTTVQGGQQAYMGMFGTTASLVVQVVRGRHYEAAFAWQENGTGDFYGATLVVDWTGGAGRPTLKFE